MSVPLGPLFRKDLSLQWRRREGLAVVFLFGLLVVLVFAFAYGPLFVPAQLDAESRRRELAKLAAAVFWVAVAFGGTIALHRTADTDREHGALDAIRLSGADPLWIYFARVLALCCLLGALELFLAPLTVVLLQVDTFRWTDALRLAAVAGAGTLGLAGLGALIASLTGSARGRESLLTVLLMPLMIPLVIAATKCTVPVFASEPIAEREWLGLLMAYPPIALAIGVLFYETAIEE